MPLYEIRHTTPLTQTQRATLASKITTLHATTFNAPSFFVNVHFFGLLTNSSEPQEQQQQPSTFTGGKPLPTNMILGYQRPRPNPNPETISHILTQLSEIWDSVVLPSEPSDPITNTTNTTTPSHTNNNKTDYFPSNTNPLSLHTIYLLPAIRGGWKVGFEIPGMGGKDEEWVKENLAEFERRARNGDEGMGRLVEEVRERGLGGT